MVHRDGEVRNVLLFPRVINLMMVIVGVVIIMVRVRMSVMMIMMMMVLPHSRATV
jgi:hypothetical protein